LVQALGQVGSVGREKIRSASSACSRRAGPAVVLKIRWCIFSGDRTVGICNSLIYLALVSGFVGNQAAADS
jgi:hypothetical protein